MGPIIARPRRAGDGRRIARSAIAVLVAVAAIAAIRWWGGSARWAREARGAPHAREGGQRPAAAAGAPAPGGGDEAPRSLMPAAAAPLAGMDLLHALRDRARDAKVIHEAEELAVVECMAERSLDYVPEPYPEGPASEVALTRAQPGDVDAAAAVGYGLAESLHAQTPSPPSANAQQVAQLSDEQRARWEAALLGPPPPDAALADLASTATFGVVSWDGQTQVGWNRDSCVAWAQRRVHGDDVTRMAFEARTEAILRKARARLDEDAEYAASLRRWRDCMGGYGLRYERPGDAEKALRNELASGALTEQQLPAREIGLATAEARCFQQAELGKVTEAATLRAEQAVASEERDELASLGKLQADSSFNARNWAEAGGLR